MKEIKNYYFKASFDGPVYISGLRLPNPVDGPYRFIDCEFHPGLRDVLDKEYGNCEFVNCYR